MRYWLNNQARLQVPGPEKIWARFNEFMAYNFDYLIEEGFSKHDIDNLPIDELMKQIKRWVKKNRD